MSRELNVKELDRLASLLEKGGVRGLPFYMADYRTCAVGHAIASGQFPGLRVENHNGYFGVSEADGSELFGATPRTRAEEAALIRSKLPVALPHLRRHAWEFEVCD